MVIGIAAVVMTGWIFDVDTLKRLVPGSALMKFNSALTFFLAGLSLRGAGICRSLPCRRMGQLCAGLVILIGVLTLAEYLSGRDLAIDNLFVQEPAAVAGKYLPGRMSSQTALGFVFFGIAYLLSGAAGWRRTVSRALLWCVVFLSLVSLVGYLYSALFRSGVSQIIGMAIHTSFAFLLLCAGLFGAMYESQPAQSLLLGEGPGGVMARRLLPVAFLLPLLLGWFRVDGVKTGIYETPAGAAFFIVCTITFFTVLVSITARKLHLLDNDRRAAVDARDHTIAELKQALEEVRTLRGLLPMCAWCKKVRNDQGYWDDVASYIMANTSANVSHGICPECAKEHFPTAKRT